jgi:hypothetical protein
MRIVGKAFLLFTFVATLTLPLTPTLSAGQSTGTKPAAAPTGGNQSNQKGQPTPTGSTPASNAPFESQMLAYAATDHIAAAIAAKACENLNHKSIVVIYDSASFSNVLAYTSFNQETKMLADAYRQLAERLGVTYGKSETASIAGAEAVVSLLAQLATASNTEGASSITIADTTMQIKIAHELVTNCKVPEAPADLSSGVQAVPVGQKPTPPPRSFVPVVIAPQFGTAIHGGNGAQSDEEAAEADVLTDFNFIETYISKQLAKLTKGPTTPEGLEYTELNTLFAAFIQKTFAVNATTGVPSFSLIVQGDVLDKLLKREETVVIFSQVLAAGGTMKTRKNLLTSLSVGDLISYSGGAVVAVAILQTRCAAAPCSPIAFSDVFRYRTPFGRLHKPTNVAHVLDGANFEDKLP